MTRTTLAALVLVALILAVATLILARVVHASAAPQPAALDIRAYADMRGVSVYWQPPDGQAWACVQRRGLWPPGYDTLIGCVETPGGVMHVTIRDLEMRMDRGGVTWLTVYDDDMQPLAWGQEATRERWQTWFGLWWTR